MAKLKEIAMELNGANMNQTYNSVDDKILNAYACRLRNEIAKEKKRLFGHISTNEENTKTKQKSNIT